MLSIAKPARNVTFRARVAAHAGAEAIRDLMRHTDTVAEIQNTLRLGMPVMMSEVEAIAI